MFIEADAIGFASPKELLRRRAEICHHFRKMVLGVVFARLQIACVEQVLVLEEAPDLQAVSGRSIFPRQEALP